MGEQTGAKHICAGLLAHVDAGKTTLSEALLYCAGALRRLGRVDHGDAFLDTHSLERARGITIFSKQARLTVGDTELTLLDTPGHVDFSTETERTLRVLDYAILVVSATDGVQAHTKTLWELLRRYQVPTIIFVNKTDLPGLGAEGVMENLHRNLSSGCVSFSREREAVFEEAALCDEAALEEYLGTGRLREETLRSLISREKLFPCFFGSALKLEGIEAFLRELDCLTEAPSYPEAFTARVYKIARDPQGNRITYLKVTGGSLRVRSALSYCRRNGEPVEEKVKELRLYSGARFTQTEEAGPGEICGVLGLSGTWPGQGLGAEPQGPAPVLEPVMTFRLELPPETDPARLLPRLLELSEEDPQLHIAWDTRLREIQVRLMGRVQTEVLSALIRERFGVEVSFGAGRILYRETIAQAVEGVGHYEPLRHYAEVHLLLEPLPRGAGLVFDTACSEDQLDRNWQRLILTHLEEKTHLGVLTGSPIGDMKITLVSGRAHLKHTEGGDFRQATYRAVRQGLMQARSILLEPYYRVRLTVPLPQAGRAQSDLRTMGAEPDQEVQGDLAVLTGRVPVAALGDYAAQVAAYTRGLGRLSCLPDGYEPCRNQEAVVEALGYDPEGDLENTPDSVFCAHGAGFAVKWRDVPRYMHLEPALKVRPAPPPAPSRGPSQEELEKIMEREFGPIRRPLYGAPRTAPPERPAMEAPRGKEYLIVDGYNVLFAWDGLQDLAKEDLEAARERLMDILSNYSAYTHREVVLVFDGYKVRGSRGERFLRNNLLVVYTRENETADAYIEALAGSIGKNDRVWVATSDSLIQLSAFRSGLLRISARELQDQIQRAGADMAAYLKHLDNTQKIKEQEERKKEWSRILSRLHLPSEPC